MDTAEIKKASLDNGVPIIMDATAKALITAVKKYKPARILEIGGGMGYSAGIILSAIEPEKFVSIEKDKARYLVLKEVLNRKNCTAIWDDAYNTLGKMLNDGENKPSYKDDGEYFDFVFLDGAKAQYGKYFNFIDKLLTHKGVIFADNMNFHGMVTGEIPVSKGAGTIVRGLLEFRGKLEHHNYSVEYLPDGDGIIIARKK
jgi:predicted O-methyltransferase YrrM